MVDRRDSLAFAVVGAAAIGQHLGIDEEDARRLCEADAFPCFRAGGERAATRSALALFRLNRFAGA